MFDYSLDTRANNGLLANYSYDDTLWNGHLGLGYKLSPQGMIYGSFGSAADINGGESDVGTSSGYGGLVVYNGSSAAAKPERSNNWELGTKWNVLDDKLLLTAALFQSTKSGVMEGANYDSIGTFNTGKNRVRGIELGMAGNITERLSGQVGMAFMKSEVLESATAANVGKALSNFADNSASAQLKYQATNAFSFGGAVRYESERCAGQPDSAAGFDAAGNCSQPVPSYTVFDLFAAYRFNKHLEARVNVNNVTDKDYFLAAYRSGSFLYKGDARAVRVTLEYDF
jgi:catecholate siderophore receptor